MKKLLFGALFCTHFAFAAPTISLATSDDGAFEAVSHTCEEQFKRQQFDQLEKFLRENDDNFHKDVNGFEMTSICLWRNFDNPQKIIEWKKQYPNSIYPFIVKQKELTQKFFEKRGAGYINSIPKEKLIEAYILLDNGAKEIDSSKNLGPTPLWYQQRIKIAFLQPDKKLFFNYVNEAINKYPDYLPLYTEAASSMRPEWGFSYKDLDNFARSSMNNSKLKEVVYTSVYKSAVTPCCSKKIIEAGYFDKDLYRRGMYLILNKYPTQLNYNRYAQFSCLLGDVESTRYIMQQKMKIHVQAIWYPDIYQYCYNLIK